MMEQDWNTFVQTGRIEDYLRYKGAWQATASKEETAHADHPEGHCDPGTIRGGTG